MNSEKIAGILGTIVALAVLAAAFVYVPPGGNKMPAKQSAAPTTAPDSPVTPAPAAPAGRGPVVRDVPQ